MSVAGGIPVIGAILTFALSRGTVGGLDLRIVGVILMLGGGVTLVASPAAAWQIALEPVDRP
ncbi:hypothetical protein ETD86_29370 [Nonomuraea turkmeniaca]|uniref:Uncharacterized protein n=1 Tax=Nonomuraea turkmeniaca TaxID=103838 RepID=A0A5S4FAM7_9ACTN|nr:hypothetical protein [Nonomuraea turkmeniaca]TMR14139.1 hypothetical protein ETD86_29370 [Nonomuraea turkmeniaca]